MHFEILTFKYTLNKLKIKKIESITCRVPIAGPESRGRTPETKGLNMGFTHVYLLTFKSAATRDAYLPHPEYKNFGALLGRVGCWKNRLL